MKPFCFLSKTLRQEHLLRCWGIRRRPVRAFDPVEGANPVLERRELLSTAPRVTIGVARAVEQANVTYPTPAGPSEQLNLYFPPGPTPSDGRPVIIAIHGGGWRRLDKSGYGRRIATA